jgi:uncharacterized tellurite resistance protein B-like protein
MMGHGWDVLGWLGVERPPVEPGALDAVTRVLDRLDIRRARYVAAFAYLLGRVAGADNRVSDEERRVITRLVADEGGLSSDEANATVTLALEDVGRFGGTHNFIVAREFGSLATPAERLGLLRCLFAVSAADESVELSEDNEIRRISRELRIEHADFINARIQVRNHLAVLRRGA